MTATITVVLLDGSTEALHIEHPEPTNWWAGRHPNSERTGWEMIGNPAYALHAVGRSAGTVQDWYWPFTAISSWRLS